MLSHGIRGDNLSKFEETKEIPRVDLGLTGLTKAEDPIPFLDDRRYLDDSNPYVPWFKRKLTSTIILFSISAVVTIFLLIQGSSVSSVFVFENDQPTEELSPKPPIIIDEVEKVEYLEPSERAETTLAPATSTTEQKIQTTSASTSTTLETTTTEIKVETSTTVKISTTTVPVKPKIVPAKIVVHNSNAGENGLRVSKVATRANKTSLYIRPVFSNCTSSQKFVAYFYNGTSWISEPEQSCDEPLAIQKKNLSPNTTYGFLITSGDSRIYWASLDTTPE